MPEYYTYKNEVVPLKPGERLGFTTGRGYYAIPAPPPPSIDLHGRWGLSRGAGSGNRERRPALQDAAPAQTLVQQIVTAAGG